MTPSGRDDFEIAIGETIPHQRTLRPEEPMRSLTEFVRFLEELEEMLGPISQRKESRGDRFLL